MSSRYFLAPTGVELTNAMDITDYVTTDGLKFAPEDEAEIMRLQSNYQHRMNFTSDDLGELAKAMNARVYQKARKVERAMNTNKHYPTSKPPWERRRK